VEILIRSESENGADVEAIRSAAAFALRAELGERATGCELSILLVGPERIRQLNKQYRGDDRETDVLAFPQSEGGEPEQMLGDIVICPAVAARQAEQVGHPLRHELALLVVHGVLHLLGFRDDEEPLRRRMFARQEQIWQGWLSEAGEQG